MCPFFQSFNITWTFNLKFINWKLATSCQFFIHFCLVNCLYVLNFNPCQIYFQAKNGKKIWKYLKQIPAFFLIHKTLIWKQCKFLIMSSNYYFRIFYYPQLSRCIEHIRFFEAMSFDSLYCYSIADEVKKRKSEILNNQENK